MFHLNSSIDIKRCCHQAQFSNKEMIMKASCDSDFRMKFFRTPNSKNNCTPVTIKKNRVVILVTMFVLIFEIK